MSIDELINDCVNWRNWPLTQKKDRTTKDGGSTKNKVDIGQTNSWCFESKTVGHWWFMKMLQGFNICLVGDRMQHIYCVQYKVYWFFLQRTCFLQTQPKSLMISLWYNVNKYIILRQPFKIDAGHVM